MLSSEALMAQARISLVALACLLVCIALRATPTAAQTQTPPPADFPAGPNRDVVVKVCKDCHPVTQVTKRRETRAKWSEITGKMLGEGAQISNDEFEKVVVYLSVALGKPIKINQASADDLSYAFDIDEESAAAIVKYRGEKGPFKEWKDLLKVPGLDSKRVEEMKDTFDFTSALPVQPAS